MHKPCPVCDQRIHYRAWKRHMVSRHDWRYIDPADPNEPKPVPHWYRWRDEAGRFLSSETNEGTDSLSRATPEHP